jgi:hypothetical protein
VGALYQLQEEEEGKERKERKKESEKQSIELNGQSSNINGFTEMSSSMIGCCIDRAFIEIIEKVLIVKCCDIRCCDIRRYEQCVILIREAKLTKAYSKKSTL